MIELRWLSFESSVNQDTGEHFMLPSTYRRLQYRRFEDQWVVVTDEFGAGVGKTTQKSWSEWQDVPVVPCADIQE